MAVGKVSLKENDPVTDRLAQLNLRFDEDNVNSVPSAEKSSTTGNDDSFDVQLTECLQRITP